MGGGGGGMKPLGPLQRLINDLKKKAPKPLQLLGGLAVGALGHLAGINPGKVVMGIDTVAGDLQNLFNGFKLTPDGLKDTVQNVANTVRDMSDVLNDAGLHDLANKANKVAEIANKAEGWIVKGETIAYKGINIYHDLQKAAKDFKAGNLYEVGQDIGTILNAIHPNTMGGTQTAPMTAPPLQTGGATGATGNPQPMGSTGA
jgi:methyl-accepting chemotaxis protein